MAVLDVLHFPDPRLRNKAVPVKQVDDDVRRLANDMLETMYTENGIGLAATQVNIQQRLLVLDISHDRTNPMVLVNPEILAAEGTEEMQEGCLSVPDVFDTVIRPEKITVRFQTLDDEHLEIQADGLLAVCIQHEIDHLDGKLFIDYLSPLKRQRITKKLEKQEKLERYQASPL